MRLRAHERAAALLRLKKLAADDASHESEKLIDQIQAVEAAACSDGMEQPTPADVLEEFETALAAGRPVDELKAIRLRLKALPDGPDSDELLRANELLQQQFAPRQKAGMPTEPPPGGDSVAEAWRGQDPLLLQRCAADWLRRLGEAGKGERISAALLHQDLGRLDAGLKHVIEWTNKTIAHLDSEPPATIPIFNDLSEALDLLGDVLSRYELLLEQTVTIDRDAPTIQGDWQQPFRPALFPIEP